MLDEQYALRDYLLTHDPASLQAYLQAEARRRRANATLSSDVGAIHGLALALVDTRLSEERWRADWANAAADEHSTGGALSIAAGKPLFEAYRNEQTAFALALERQTADLA